MPAMTVRKGRRSGARAPRPPVRFPARVLSTARRLALAAALAGIVAAGVETAGARASDDQGQRFVSLRAEVANLRVGPGRRYPIDWVYRRQGLPLLVIAHFDQWRWVRDHEGTKGWMHKSLLSVERTVLIMDEEQTVRERPSADAPAVLRAEPGVIADLLGCEDGWCRIALAGEEGWVRSTALWGAVLPAP